VELKIRYCSGVSILLSSTKYSRPAISNVVRELSKCMDDATTGIYLKLLRVIKFILDAKSFGLKIRPSIGKKNWGLNVFLDSVWAGDPETKICVKGFIIYLLGMPVSWRSKARRGVTLSSSEAEYVVISDAVKEIKLMYYFDPDFFPFRHC
jgi:hypothetical protein